MTRLLNSAIGVIAVAALLIGVNLFADSRLSHLQLDLTAQRLYTLSPCVSCLPWRPTRWSRNSSAAMSRSSVNSPAASPKKTKEPAVDKVPLCVRPPISS